MGCTVLLAPHCWQRRCIRRVALSLSRRVSTDLQPGHNTYLHTGTGSRRCVTPRLATQCMCTVQKKTDSPSHDSTWTSALEEHQHAEGCFQHRSDTSQLRCATPHGLWSQTQLMNSLVDISTQHCLERLGQEASLADKPLLTIQAATSTQLSKQVRADMFIVTVHGLAQVHEVGEHSLLGTFTSNLQACSEHDMFTPSSQHYYLQCILQQIEGAAKSTILPLSPNK